jgi:hypothetical protein
MQQLIRSSDRAFRRFRFLNYIKYWWRGRRNWQSKGFFFECLWHYETIEFLPQIGHENCQRDYEAEGYV